MTYEPVAATRLKFEIAKVIVSYNLHAICNTTIERLTNYLIDCIIAARTLGGAEDNPKNEIANRRENG